jgi:hypothetical protein
MFVDEEDFKENLLEKWDEWGFVPGIKLTRPKIIYYAFCCL